MSSFSAGQTYYHCSQRRSTNPDDPQAIPVSQSEPSWHLSVAVEARGLIPEHVKPTPAGSGPLDEVRILAIITTDANDLVAEIHDRMPLILAPTDYVRWLSGEPDPRDLMRPFPAEPMRMWPISTRINNQNSCLVPCCPTPTSCPLL